MARAPEVEDPGSHREGSGLGDGGSGTGTGACPARSEPVVSLDHGV